MKQKRIRIKAGDIFQLPIDENNISFGQVVENKKGGLRVITFNKITSKQEESDLGKILQSDIVLLTDTMDALLYHGNWKIIGNMPVVENLPKPKFKFGLDPVYVTDYGSNLARIATSKEADELDYAFSVSPIRIQNAMQAYFGIKEWEKDFDKLTYKYCLEKSKIVI